MNKYISYYRVSTQQQGRSGLGLEAQQQAVTQYLKNIDHEIVGEFIEVQSGRKVKKLTQLHLALKLCKEAGATLIIAKLDRLARNLHFISGLMENKIDFIVADNPKANKFTLHMLAAFAEYERELISQRTKEALAAAKARGVILGSYAKNVQSKANKEKALEHALKLRSVINDINACGYYSVVAVRDELNRRNIPSTRGGKWHVPTVHRLLKRLEI
jgi:DNA invertase Pin-like site-specific DNA recombinase